MGRLQIVAAAALLVGTAGSCADKKSNPSGSPTSAASIEGIAAIPATVDVILGADIAQLVRSELVSRAVAGMLTADPALAEEIEQLFSGCELSPSRDVRTALVAMDTDPEGADRTLLVATGSFREGALATCVGRHMREGGGDLTQEMVDGRRHYHAAAGPGEQSVWFALSSPKTLVVSSSPAFLRDALGTSPRITADRELSALVEKARSGLPALWAAGRVPPEIGEGLRAASAEALSPPRAMFAKALLEGGGLGLELGAVMASEAEAKTAISLTQRQLDVLAQIAQKWRLGALVAKIRVEAVSEVLFVRLVLDEGELRAALGGVSPAPAPPAPSGAAAPIDSGAPDAQTTAPPLEEEKQGVRDGQGDAAPGG